MKNMNKNCFYKLFSLVALGGISVFSLSGCDSFRNTFGLDHYQPDEFKVSDNPPLSMPKDYRLRPPGDGSSNNQVNVTGSPSASQAQAQNLLLGANSATPASKGSSEQTLLAMANAKQQAAPDIRNTVNKEAAVTTNVSDALIQRIIGWREEAARNISSINGEQATQPTTAPSEQKAN